jgi:hypothetical protein
MGKSLIKPEDDIFFTHTMARLLEEQGQMEDAYTIYKILAAASPQDEIYCGKVRDMKALAIRKKIARKARRAR